MFVGTHLLQRFMATNYMLVLCFMHASIANSQAVPELPPNVDPAEELVREQEDDRRRDDLENFETRPTPEPSASDQAEVNGAGGPCINIDKIDVRGAKRLGIKAHILMLPFAPACMTRANIAAVMETIDKAYVERGLITSRAYIEQQDFKDGILKLKVVEGFVEGINLVDNNGTQEPHRRSLTAFSSLKGEVLDLRDLEQGLDQINRLKSAKATLKMSPGETPGGTMVNVNVKDKHRVRVSAGWNNYGSPATGKDQIRLSLAGENILLANDIWGLSYSGTLDSNALSLNTSVPYGYVTFNLSAVASDYLIGLTQTSELYGSSTSLQGGVNYVFNRSSKTKSYAELGVQYRNAKRFVNSFELTPQVLATVQLTGGHIIESKKTKLSFDVSYINGTTGFGANEDPKDISDQDPNAQFHAIELGVSRVLKPQKWGRWVLSARGKFSEVALYGPEQTPLGTRSTVRGFESAPFSADRALYIRNDVILNMGEGWKSMTDYLPGGNKSMLGAFAQSVKPYVFLDVGVGHSQSQETTNSVGGFGGGLKFNGKRLNLDIGTEVPVARREFRAFNPPRFMASVAVNWP